MVHSAREVLVEVTLVNFGPVDTSPGKFETAFSFWKKFVFSVINTLENVDELGLCLWLRRAGGKSYIIVVDLIVFKQLPFQLEMLSIPHPNYWKRKAGVFKSLRFNPLTPGAFCKKRVFWTFWTFLNIFPLFLFFLLQRLTFHWACFWLKNF